MKTWNELSIKDKNDIIRVAVQNGITALPDIRERYNEFAEGGDMIIPADENLYSEGGKIHIKPENRGKFTALKERTGHSASWFKAHGTPAQRKMATFALNSRKWRHGDGGHLYDGESEDTQQMDVVNSYPMSLQDYIAQRIQDTKDSAANVMRTRGMPKVLYSNKRGNQRASEISEEIAQVQRQLDEAKSKVNGATGLSRQMLEANIKALEGSVYNMNQEMYKAAAYGEGYIPVGSTCLYTLTDSFGSNRAVPGTQSFVANMKGTDTPLYQTKGFRRVGAEEELEPADALIFYKNGVPHHAEMYEGTSQKRQPKGNKQPVRTTYSNGQYTSEAMRVNKDYNWFDPAVDAAFRFVGNAADSARWTNEYNVLMQDSPVVQKRFGGLI